MNSELLILDLVKLKEETSYVMFGSTIREMIDKLIKKYEPKEPAQPSFEGED